MLTFFFALSTLLLLLRQKSMSQLEQFWNFRATTSGSGSGGENDQTLNHSSGNEQDTFVFPGSYLTQSQSNSWFPISNTTATATSQVDDFQDVFGELMLAPISSTTSSSMQLQLPNASTITATEFSEKGQASGTKRKLDDDHDQMVLHKSHCDSSYLYQGIGISEVALVQRKPNEQPLKRTRSAEVHNMSERRRRDRINERLKTLQQLIPSCNKSDRASVLDDAINYIKALKLQVDMMSASRGPIFQAPYMLPSGVQGTQFSPFMSIRPPNLGMGIGFGMGMPYTTDVPPSGLGLHPSLISAHGNLAAAPQAQMEMPFIHSQQLPGNFGTSFSPALNFSNQGGGSTSQTFVDHHQQMATITNKWRP